MYVCVQFITFACYSLFWLVSTATITQLLWVTKKEIGVRRNNKLTNSSHHILFISCKRNFCPDLSQLYLAVQMWGWGTWNSNAKTLNPTCFCCSKRISCNLSGLHNNFALFTDGWDIERTASPISWTLTSTRRQSACRKSNWIVCTHSHTIL